MNSNEMNSNEKLTYAVKEAGKSHKLNIKRIYTVESETEVGRIKEVRMVLWEKGKK